MVVDLKKEVGDGGRCGGSCGSVPVGILDSEFVNGDSLNVTFSRLLNYPIRTVPVV